MTTTVIPGSFDTALANFMTQAQALIKAAHERKGYKFSHDVLSVMPGKRYIRVVASHGGGRRVYCFVDKTNGDVLKAASWKAPAKHARGNIYAADPVAGCTEYGGAYLR
jgi:hypothetical protein